MIYHEVIRTYLCKAVEDSDAPPDPSPQDVGDQEVDTTALHLTALTHSYSTQCHDQHQEHSHKDHQDRQQNTSIPLNKQINTSMNIVTYLLCFQLYTFQLGDNCYNEYCTN